MLDIRWNKRRLKPSSCIVNVHTVICLFKLPFRDQPKTTCSQKDKHVTYIEIRSFVLENLTILLIWSRLQRTDGPKFQLSAVKAIKGSVWLQLLRFKMMQSVPELKIASTFSCRYTGCGRTVFMKEMKQESNLGFYRSLAEVPHEPSRALVEKTWKISEKQNKSE